MPSTARDEQVEALELQRKELLERRENGEMTAAEMKKALSKLDFRLAQIREAIAQESGKSRSENRSQGFFND